MRIVFNEKTPYSGHKFAAKFSKVNKKGDG
jgi:hypothetical protein